MNRGTGSGPRVYLRALPRAIFLMLAVAVRAEEAGLQLANELTAQDDHAGAAVEFHRLALRAPDAAGRAAFFWSAAHAWWRADEPGRAERLLDRAEDALGGYSAEIALLRGEAAALDRRPAEAAFFFESAARALDGDGAAYARRRQAAALLETRDAPAALRAVEAEGQPAVRMVEAYASGRDKRPAFGGWLGLAPGLGYAYAGEYANALRSLILNGLFIWGLVETAGDEEWGAFAALTFFEITWYSGSIYGGIDASHRHNRRRLDRAAAELTAGFGLQSDPEALPALRLRYRW